MVCDLWTREESRRHYAPGTEFHIGRIEMVANTGTYLDSPFHRYADGRDFAGLRLESLADLQGVVVRVAGQPGRGIDAAALAGWTFAGRRSWSIPAGTPTGGPTLLRGPPVPDPGRRRWLPEDGAALVGIDSLNIDDTSDPRRSAHSTLLGADIPIVEHLCGLGRLPEAGFRFFAVPVKVLGLGTFPVRAFAVI